MSAVIRIVRAGFVTSVQDRGRSGLRHLGIPSAGALDWLALSVANALAANSATMAGVEITAGNVVVEFGDRRRFSLCGAETGAELDGSRIPAWSTGVAEAGQRLTLHAPTDGMRTYFAVNGGISVDAVMGSRSTDLAAGFGGFKGRRLLDGDMLPLGDAPFDADNAAAPVMRVKPPEWEFDPFVISALATPEFAGDLADGAFWNTPWRVLPQSDRIGVRLDGAAARPHSLPERASHGVFPGIIQLPPDGRPIVLLNDAQTTGGYPVVAAVCSADLRKFAQLRPGQEIRFVHVNGEQAGEAMEQVERYRLHVEEIVAERLKA